MGPGAAEIAQIAPELRNQIGGVPELPSAHAGQAGAGPVSALRLPDRLFRQCRRGSASLLIVLDDLHAADPTSLLMLVAFSRQVRGMRVTAIGTYRASKSSRCPSTPR